MPKQAFLNIRAVLKTSRRTRPRVALACTRARRSQSQMGSNTDRWMHDWALYSRPSRENKTPNRIQLEHFQTSKLGTYDFHFISRRGEGGGGGGPRPWGGDRESTTLEPQPKKTYYDSLCCVKKKNTRLLSLAVITVITCIFTSICFPCFLRQ